MSLSVGVSSFLRGLHILSICAWLGGGLTVLLLLSLGRETESAEELQAYNLVIIAIDDFLITPGAGSTLCTGLILAHCRRLKILRNNWLLSKLLITVAAICFGAFALGPWLREMLAYSIQDGGAIFLDTDYTHSYHAGIIGGMAQTTVLLGLLAGSVFRSTKPEAINGCSKCPLLRSNP